MIPAVIGRFIMTGQPENPSKLHNFLGNVLLPADKYIEELVYEEKIPGTDIPLLFMLPVIHSKPDASFGITHSNLGSSVGDKRLSYGYVIRHVGEILPFRQQPRYGDNVNSRSIKSEDLLSHCFWLQTEIQKSGSPRIAVVLLHPQDRLYADGVLHEFEVFHPNMHTVQGTGETFYDATRRDMRIFESDRVASVNIFPSPGEACRPKFAGEMTFEVHVITSSPT